MKKNIYFFNIFFVILALWMLVNFVSYVNTISIAAKYLNTFPNDESLHSYYANLLTKGSIYAFINMICFLSSIAALFLFNYRFDGVPLREKLAARLAESREKRAQHKAEKAAADRQAAIEDKQKRLEKLQAEMEKLNTPRQ